MNPLSLAPTSGRIHFLSSMRRQEIAGLASDLLPVLDLLLLLAIVWPGALLYGHFSSQLPAVSGVNSGLERIALVAAVLAPFILYDRRFGNEASLGQIGILVRSHVLRFFIFAAIVLGIADIGSALINVPFAGLFAWFSISLLLTSLTRIGIAKYVRHLQRQGVLTEVIAIVGSGPVADRLAQVLQQTPPGTTELLGIFDDKIIGALPSLLKSTGNLNALIEIGKTRKIDWILLTLPATAEQRVLSIVQRLKSLSVPLALCPPHVGLAIPYNAIDYVGDTLPVNLLANRPIERWNSVSKRGEDLLIASLVGLLLLPLLACIAVAIKLSSPGPIIFKQRRHAVNNREFDIYKFRTMRWSPLAATEGLQQTSRNDTRITFVGRLLRATSFDELPQLLNVLKGEMSLVGPRPHAVEMRTDGRLGHEILEEYPHRHRVKPGMTGWSQVNGARGATHTMPQLRRRLELDLHYINNWSLLLDLKILFKTPAAILRGTNAF